MQKDHQPYHQDAHPRHLLSSSGSSSTSSCSSSASYRPFPYPTASVDPPPSDTTTTDFSPCLDLDSSSESSIHKPPPHCPTPSFTLDPSLGLVTCPAQLRPHFDDPVERVTGGIVEKNIYVTEQDAAVRSTWAEEIKQDALRAAIPSARALNVQKQVSAELPLIRSPRLAYSENGGSKGLHKFKTNTAARRKPSEPAEAVVDSDSGRNQALTVLPAGTSAMPGRGKSTAKYRGNSTVISLKASSREHESLLGSDGRITGPNAVKRSPAHQSSKEGPANFDFLNRYVAANKTSGDNKGTQFTSSQDARIECPSPATSWSSKQFLTRSPRSPDALLSYDSVKIIHSVRTSSKWDDAEKWLSSPPNQPNIAAIACSNAQGCGGFAAQTLRLLGKSSSPASLSAETPEKQRHARLAQTSEYKRSSRQLATYGAHANPQPLQQRSNRPAKQRNAAPSSPQGLTETRRLHEKEDPAWSDPRQGSVTPSCTGTPNSESTLHSPQVARMLPSNDPAVPSDPSIPIDRTQRGCPSPVHVLEKKASCQNSEHRCADCGSTFSSVRNTDGVLAVSQTKYVRGSRMSEFSIMDNAVQPLSPFKDRVVVSVVLKDAGTQMTPVESSSTTTRYSSKCPSPARHNTPARPSQSPSHGARNSGLDLVELARCHRSKLELQGLSQGERICSFRRTHSNWSSREAEEEQIGQSLRHSEPVDGCTDSTSADPTTLVSNGKDERCKGVARLKREEARIQAWENHKKAQAEAELRKLEAKLEKRRAERTDKIMSRLTAAHRQAQEMRTQIRNQATEFKPRSAPKEFLQTHLCVCFSSSP